MSPVDDLQKRITEMEAVLFGIHGTDGLVEQFKGFRNDFAGWRREDRERREAESKDRISDARKQVGNLVTACIALLAIIVSLFGMVVHP